MYRESLPQPRHGVSPGFPCGRPSRSEKGDVAGLAPSRAQQRRASDSLTQLVERPAPRSRFVARHEASGGSIRRASCIRRLTSGCGVVDPAIVAHVPDGSTEVAGAWCRRRRRSRHECESMEDDCRMPNMLGSTRASSRSLGSRRATSPPDSVAEVVLAASRGGVAAYRCPGENLDRVLRGLDFGRRQLAPQLRRTRAGSQSPFEVQGWSLDEAP